MCDDLGNLLNFWRFQIDDVVGSVIVLKVPQMNPEIIGRQEVFSIWTDTKGVNIIVVAITKLHLLNSFKVAWLLFWLRED